MESTDQKWMLWCCLHYRFGRYLVHLSTSVSSVVPNSIGFPHWKQPLCLKLTLKSPTWWVQDWQMSYNFPPWNLFDLSRWGSCFHTWNYMAGNFADFFCRISQPRRNPHAGFSGAGEKRSRTGGTDTSSGKQLAPSYFITFHNVSSYV